MIPLGNSATERSVLDNGSFVNSLPIPRITSLPLSGHPTSAESNVEQKEQGMTPIPVLNRQNANASFHSDIARTAVASPNDARALLFKAADQQDTDDSDDQPVYTIDVDQTSPASASTSNTKIFLPVVTLSQITEEDVNLWKQHRFVRQGWFTAQEAVTYIDL